MFCARKYIKAELKLTCGVRTVQRALNRRVFSSVAVPKKSPLSDKQLAARKAWVDKLIHEGPGWRANHMS